MKNYKGIIFDLYGTLIEYNSKNVYSRILKGSSNYQKDIAKDIALCNEISFRDFHLEFGLNCPEDYTTLEKDLELELSSTQIIKPNLDLLLAYKKKGAKIGLISNLAIPYIEPFYKLGLSELFDFELFSCEIGFKKPEKLAFQLMLKQLKLEANEVLMVGDSLKNDLLPAESIGIDSFLVGKNRYLN